VRLACARHRVGGTGRHHGRDAAAHARSRVTLPCQRRRKRAVVDKLRRHRGYCLRLDAEHAERRPSGVSALDAIEAPVHLHRVGVGDGAQRCAVRTPRHESDLGACIAALQRADRPRADGSDPWRLASARKAHDELRRVALGGHDAIEPI
jgi:hypothetical protein